MEGSAHRETIRVLPRALKVFVLASCGLTILSFAYAVVCRYLDMGLPYSFPYYYVPGDLFGDFFDAHDKFRRWGTPEFFKHDDGYFMYPAPMVHVYRALFSAPHTRTFYALFMFVVIAFLAASFLRILVKEGLPGWVSAVFVGTVVLVSYPLAFELQRWNVEVLIWGLSSVAVWSFFSGRTTQSASLLGLAASMKLYPFILLGLFLPRRKYWSMALAVAVFAAVTLLSLYGIGPTIVQAANWDKEQIAAFGKYFVGSLWALGYDHSFFGLVKAFTMHWHPDYFLWGARYTKTMAILCILLYFLRIWRLPLPNQILALSILSITIAPISYDYTLLNLYAPFAVLVVLALRAERGGPPVPHLMAYMVLFAMILTPQSYVVFRGVRYGAQVRCLCLFAMLILAITTPIFDSVSSDTRKITKSAG